MFKIIKIILFFSFISLSANEVSYSKPVSKDILGLIKDINIQNTQIEKEIVKLKNLIDSEKNFLTEKMVDEYNKENKKWKIYKSEYNYKLKEYKSVSYLENILDKIQTLYLKKEKEHKSKINILKNKIKCYKNKFDSCENIKLSKYYEQIQFLYDLKKTLEDNLLIIKKEYFTKYNILEKGIINNLVELKTQINNQLVIIK